MRAAIVVDVAVSLATLPVLSLIMGVLNAILWRIDPPTQQHVTWWSIVRMPTITLVLAGVVVALLARLAARGQTPGLAITGLCWTENGGRPAWRRLLADRKRGARPPYRVDMSHAPRRRRPLLRAFGFVLGHQVYVIGPALVLGALTYVVVSRRSPGQLVNDSKVE